MGVMFDDKVLCPAHAAGFSVLTGASENAPGLDSLQKYEIVEEKKQFYVMVPDVIE
jgi:nitrite reductase/ring-hydroxylating ferredoxin subunit